MEYVLRKKWTAHSRSKEYLLPCQVYFVTRSLECVASILSIFVSFIFRFVFSGAPPYSKLYATATPYALVTLPVSPTITSSRGRSRAGSSPSPRACKLRTSPAGAMAAILDAMAPYVKQLIADVAKEEVDMLLGVSGEIKKLEDNMESLKCFLADAERRRITEEIVKRWVRKLKDAMYDATDILDLCQLEADKHEENKCGSMEKASCCLQPLLFCLRNPLFAHKMGSRIKELNQRLDNIYKEAHKFNFINLGSHPEQRMSTSEKVTSEFVESAIVGEKIERETRELAQMLTINGHHDIKVVAIVGTGGMGKTTLAQKIFNETTVQEHFKVKIWLSITQHFDEVELLRTAIDHVRGDHGGLQDKTLLSRKLTNTLSTGRFLLVLDDVWSNVAWSNVLSVPVRNASKNQLGNWVLITTRLEDLALQTGASFYQYHVSPLNKDDAWLLLNKQLPPTRGQVHGTDHLKDVGMKIISKCGGLPLAIKVMGGLLSTKSRSEGDWEAVLNHRTWSIAGLPKELDNTIYLSYEHLSPQLKQCFLYCSLFPKGTSIRQREVVPMWISEGFIHPEEGSSSYDDQLEEIAGGYYQELITRNLIEPPEESALTRYSCTMHDVVRSFAEFMCKEESLVVQDEQDGGGSSHSHVRRLSIGSNKSALEWDILQKHKSVRTVIIRHRISVQPSDSLQSLSYLRVLFISGADCDRLVDSLCQLRHLRYLHFQNTNISRLPEDIHRMKFLQHIVVKGCSHLDHLPSSITQLLHLRTLSMDGSNDNVLIPKVFGQLKNLRTLYGFRVHLDMNGGNNWCSLEEIGPLSQLRDLTLQGLENVVVSSSAEKAMISSKEHIDYLVLKWSSSGFMELRDEINKREQQRVAEEVIDKLSPPSSIRHLSIAGYFGSRLPNWMMVPATCVFKSLRLLRMDKLCCCTQLPSGLCQLPCLESLEINDAPAIKSVGPEFQSPSSLVVGRGIIATRSVVTFPKLKTLLVDRLCEWEEWDWEEQGNDLTVDVVAMPGLQFVTINDCKLSCLPPGLASMKRLGLRGLRLYELSYLASVENFISVVELDVFDCPKLTRISGLSTLQRIMIVRCPIVEVLEGVPSLDSIEMEDATMETLPEYLTSVSPRYLKLTCSKKLYESLLSACSSENDKINHIKSRTIDYFGRR